MISVFERQTDILKLISQLDISPTMYKNAEEKYKSLAAFLEKNGILADIYPQGSFAFGTVVRPSANDPNANYDLDFICQLRITRDDIAPSKLRQDIEDALLSSNVYGGKLIKCGECFTIEYADISGIGFSIDIVPAVDESQHIKNELFKLSNNPLLIDTSIAIPRENGKRNYNWITNNPRGFKKWFDDINKPFLDYNRDERRAMIFENNQTLFNSVDDIPSVLEHSALQRVIQILKYHRDMYYKNLSVENHDELKPISAIINTLAAEIAQNASPASDVFTLLAYVLNTLDIYGMQQTISFEEFRQNHSTCTAITRENGKWLIQNPANPQDNLADKWNSNANIPKMFFKWVTICHKDLIESMKLSDHQFYTEMSNAFGEENVRSNWGSKYTTSSPKPINTSVVSKPYRAL
ncbi:hypothetical protein SAMN05216390_101487 [Lachnospiraceae bacterium KH1T2]|nr:hypothetical protein SAMN05216390_101487 [Lachnospiraceae bacterium KH1T2]